MHVEKIAGLQQKLRVHLLTIPDLDTNYIDVAQASDEMEIAKILDRIMSKNIVVPLIDARKECVHSLASLIEEAKKTYIALLSQKEVCVPILELTAEWALASALPSQPSAEKRATMRETGKDFVVTLFQILFPNEPLPANDNQLALTVAKKLTKILPKQFAHRTVMRWIQGGPIIARNTFYQKLYGPLTEAGYNTAQLQERYEYCRNLRPRRSKMNW